MATQSQIQCTLEAVRQAPVAAACEGKTHLIAIASDGAVKRFNADDFKYYTSTGVDQKSASLVNPANGDVFYTHILRIDNPSTCKVMRAVFTFSVQEFSVSHNVVLPDIILYGGIRPYIQKNLNGVITPFSVIHNGTTVIASDGFKRFLVGASAVNPDIEVGGPTYPILFNIPASGFAEVQIRVEADVNFSPAIGTVGAFSTLSAIGNNTD